MESIQENTQGAKVNKKVKFWDKVAEKYAKKPIDDEETYQQKLKLTHHYLTPQMDVLEFGCGTGSTALIHAEKVKSYLATDFSPKMIEIAKDKVKKAQIKNIECKVAMLNQLNPNSQQFDAILGLNVLHLMEDYEQAIEQAYNLLKPGGVFITSTGCLKNHKNYLKWVFKPLSFFKLIPNVMFFSSQQLNSVMQEKGFKIEKSWWPPKSKTSYFLICKKPK